MKENHFETLYDALLVATSHITEKYFRLPVSYQDYVHRERAYCYELYHQIRKLLSSEFPYTLSGEVNKVGHPSIAPYCGNIIPDFLVHNPGHMGENDNLAIIEVKTIQGANTQYDGEDLLKDMATINCMTTINNGYYRGVILIFGSGYPEKKAEIAKVFLQKCDSNRVILLFHENPQEKAHIL